MRTNKFLTVTIMSLLTHAAIAADPATPPPQSLYTTGPKIACVGDSITHGSGTIPGNSYPDQLQRMLAAKYQVKNFGVSGATLLNAGDKPYQKEKLFKDSLAFNPDIVIIMLGTNDTKPQNWKFKDQFTADYKNLVDQYKNLPSKPHIYIMRPPPVPKTGAYKITEGPLDEEIPLIDAIAKDESADIIDIHTALLPHPELLPDNVHPNADGYTILAATVYTALTGEKYEGGSTIIKGLPPKNQPPKTQPAK